MGLEPDQLRKALAEIDRISGLGSVVGWWLRGDGQTLVAAARELLALKEAPTHPDYDVALPEIEEWVNDHGNW